MPKSPQRKIEELRRDRKPMLFLLASIAAVALTLSVIAYSVPENARSPGVATTR
jgi:hypothetical protein